VSCAEANSPSKSAIVDKERSTKVEIVARIGAVVAHVDELLDPIYRVERQLDIADSRCEGTDALLSGKREKERSAARLAAIFFAQSTKWFEQASVIHLVVPACAIWQSLLTLLRRCRRVESPSYCH